MALILWWPKEEGVVPEHFSHSSSSNRHQWWCHLSKDAYCVQQQQQCRRSSSVDKRPTDQPTSDSDGRNGSSHLRMYLLLLHTFDAVCLLYAQICVEMHTSLCTPISWDLMLDPCEWFSKSLSRRLKPQLTSLLGVRVCSTYCVCVTVVSQLTKSIKIYILIYISCMYIYMLGQKTWNISNHADPIEVVTKNEDIIADQNASG